MSNIGHENERDDDSGATGAQQPSLEQLSDCLIDRSQPIGKRTHAAFFLRTLGTPAAVRAVGDGKDIVWVEVRGTSALSYKQKKRRVVG